METPKTKGSFEWRFKTKSTTTKQTQPLKLGDKGQNILISETGK